MKVLKTIKVIAETKQGDIETVVNFGINWFHGDPIYSFKVANYEFTTRGRGENMFRDPKNRIQIKLKDITEFNKAIQEMVEIYRRTKPVFDQEQFDNL